MAIGDLNVALGGGHKQFYRAITGAGQYMPDEDTVGTRGYVTAGDEDINEALVAAGMAIGGNQGFTVPPGESFQVRFIGWTDATCVIQEYNPFTLAWETIFTWPATGDTPLVAQLFVLKSFNPIRIGASAIGADAATLKCIVSFGQSDRAGF
jgi:hypothetical protein